MLMAAANRPLDSRSTATTGGDVSRFQRRSLGPRKPGTVGEMNKAMEGFGKSFAKGVDDALGGSTGPSVRVARGNNVTVVPVGAR